jgi:5-methyltetrahydropteroyltriglutamate--homocysteine methyltransferase
VDGERRLRLHCPGAVRAGEAPEELIARIEEAARLFPREQLALSTQCGFASVADGNPISEQAEENKLRLVADVAHTAWA